MCAVDQDQNSVQGVNGDDASFDNGLSDGKSTSASFFVNRAPAQKNKTWSHDKNMIHRYQAPLLRWHVLLRPSLS